MTAVYFSSLALYEPTFESFRDRVVECDYYEFSRLRLARATRHVFVRDVMGLWYAKGVSVRINTLEALAKRIGEMTVGSDEVVCIGVSAGGYAAMVVGHLIGATAVYAFSPQFKPLRALELFRRFCPKSGRNDVWFDQICGLEIEADKLLRTSSVPCYVQIPELSEIDIPELESARELPSVHLQVVRSMRHGIRYGAGLCGALFNAPHDLRRQLFDAHFDSIAGVLSFFNWRERLAIAWRSSASKRKKPCYLFRAAFYRSFFGALLGTCA